MGHYIYIYIYQAYIYIYIYQGIVKDIYYNISFYHSVELNLVLFLFNTNVSCICRVPAVAEDWVSERTGWVRELGVVRRLGDGCRLSLRRYCRERLVRVEEAQPTTGVALGVEWSPEQHQTVLL